MAKAKKGTLIVIGGAQAKAQSNVILEEVVRFIGSGKLVMTTVASEKPRDYPEEYVCIFRIGDTPVHHRIKQIYEEEGGVIIMSLHDMMLHVLGQGDGFDLTDRRPKLLSKRQAEEKLPKVEPEREPESKKAKTRGQGDEGR